MPPVPHSRAVALVSLVLVGACAAMAWAQSPAAIQPLASAATSGNAGKTSTVVTGVASTSSDKFALGDGTVRLPYGAASGEFTFILAADGLGKEAMDAKTLTIRDLPTAAPSLKSEVKFRVDAELPPSTAGRRWVVTAMASGLAVNDDQSRYAALDLGDLKVTQPYALTNRVRTAPDFTVTVNSPWVLSGSDDANTVNVVTGDQAIAGLRLSNSTLAEKTNGDMLRTQHFKLCQSSGETCDPIGTLAPLSTHTLYLKLTDAARANGRFTGTLAFAVNARPDAKVVTVEVDSTSLQCRLGGAITIVLGVGLAFLLTLWSRNRLERLAALRPALEARRRILDLLDRLDTAGQLAGIDYLQLRTRYAEKAATLTEQQLDDDGLLPARMPSTTATAVSDLKTRLQSLEQPIIGLTVIVRDGVEFLAQKWRTPPTGANSQDILAGMQSLDAPDSAVAEDKAQELVAKAKKIAFPPPAAALMNLQSQSKQASVALQHVMSQIEVLSTGIWLVYLLLASVIGTAALVFGNPGFGTPMDFVYCLLWGFGLPTTMDKLQQASPASVSTAIGIQLPK